MKIRNDTWHARWFHFVQKKIGSEYRYREGTSVCHYVRVVVFWGPAVIGFWYAVGLAAAAIVILMPLQFFGEAWAALVWVAIAIVARCIQLLIKHAMRIDAALGKFFGTKPFIRAGSFIMAVVDSTAAAKASICPPVTFGK